MRRIFELNELICTAAHSRSCPRSSIVFCVSQFSIIPFPFSAALQSYTQTQARQHETLCCYQSVCYYYCHCYCPRHTAPPRKLGGARTVRIVRRGSFLPRADCHLILVARDHSRYARNTPFDTALPPSTILLDSICSTVTTR